LADFVKRLSKPLHEPEANLRDSAIPDATDTGIRPRLQPSVWLGGPAVAAAGLGSTAARANSRLSDSNRLHVEHEERLSEDGIAAEQDRLAYGGYYAASMRHYSKAIEPARRKTAWQAAFGGEGDLQVQELTVDGVDDHKQPLVVIVKYKVERAFHPGKTNLLDDCRRPGRTACWRPSESTIANRRCDCSFPCR
jgi:hypothetical protein